MNEQREFLEAQLNSLEGRVLLLGPTQNLCFELLGPTQRRRGGVPLPSCLFLAINSGIVYACSMLQI